MVQVELTVAPRQLTAEELAAGLAEILRSPQDHGVVSLIVARPATDQRRSLQQAELRPADGLIGDCWFTNTSARLPDGAPDPAVQITLMNARCIQLLTGDQAHWPLAGDNLFVDFDLSFANLPAGSRLQIGQCLLEITEPPHAGCHKFKRRFGAEAVRFVNSAEGTSLRLRGAHARILRGGFVSVGDSIHRIPPETV